MAEYVQMRNVSAEHAFADSSVVMASFRNAVEAILEMTELMQKRPGIQEATIQNFLTLKSLYDNMTGELDQIGLMLQVISQRILDVGNE